MNVEWFKDCPTVELRAERIELIKAHAPVLEVIKLVMERRLAEMEAERCKRVDYLSAGWPYLQADLNGAIRTTKFMIALLDQGEIK